MKEIFEKIWDNREWLFSGIGVLIVSVFGGLFLRKRNNEKQLAPQGNGHNYAGETINVHHSSGLSILDVRELAKSVFMENFPKLQEDAKIEAEKNRDLFIIELDKKIHEKLNTEEINKFNKPDIQFALKEAVVTASRKNSQECRTILSNLIVDRVKNDGIEFKEIVYNEAITTISRLTKNHLDILAFAFFTRYARLTNIKDWANFEASLRKFISPFIEFSSSQAQFQHLEYADCANIGLGSTRIESTFRNSYSNLFLKEENPFIDKTAYENWNLIPELKPVFFNPSEDGEKFYFVHTSVTDIEMTRNKYIKSGIAAFTDFSNVLLTKVKSDAEIIEELKSKFDFGEKLLSQFNDTSVSRLTLTSVGIVVGASHLETLTNDKLDIDIWIN
jgi:hypothetical protein